MKIIVLTLFKEMFEPFVSTSIIKRAIEKKIVSIRTIDIRDFTEDKHNRVDFPPYGGGSGKPTEETKKKIKGKNHPMSGKHISEEHKLRLKEANSGKNNPKSKRVHCIELNEFFESIGEASRKFNIHPSGISMCCTGKRKTANGYHWEYID